MTYPDPEADFHSRLFIRLDDYLSQHSEAPFSDVGIEEQTARGRADIYLQSHETASTVIEVKRTDIDPRSPDVVKQARDYAQDVNAEFFATCNANDFFLYDYRGEIEISDIRFYYVNLRDKQLRDVIPEILNAIVHLFEEDQLPNQHERERIVGLLRSFHSSVWPTFQFLAHRTYDQNEQFRSEFDTWVRANDYQSLDQDEQFSLAAKQYAYLLTNKVLFYEVVREQTPHQITTQSGHKLDSLTEATTIDRLDSHIDRKFTEIIDEIDYEPIFRPDASIFEDFPHNRKTRHAIADLVDNIESRSITEIEEDLLGEIYEELIPVAERKALGQFYTHPRIAETIARWAIPDSDAHHGIGEPDTCARVLDPASGSGTFTVEAYQQLHRQHPKLTHQELCHHLTAVDINRFPLHLTALNLASQNIREPTDVIHAHHTSFFHLDPKTDPLESSRLNTGSAIDGRIGTFDAVIGNPPYIRQEDLYPGKEHFRNHLKVFGSSRGQQYYDGSKKLSTKSDAYVYFVTHATQFLRDGGRLGYIIPTKWLMTDYGKSFQQFLFDHYKLEAVVGFSVRAFEDALVDTALLLLERCEDDAERETNVAKFIRIRDEMEPEHIVDTVEFEETVPEGEAVIKTRPNYRTVVMRQREVADVESGKLAHFLNVPQDIIKLIEHPDLIQLDDLAEVAYGNKTGANTFFFLDDDDLAEWPIDERFLTPAIKSIRDTEKMVVDSNTTDRYLLDVHDYVEEVRQSGSLGDGSDLTDRVKRALQRDGYDVLYKYIRQGEREGYDERNTCASRPVWFDLGDLKRPEILHPKFFNDRIIPMWNRDRLAPSNAVDGIYLDNGIDDKTMIGILNSTLHKVFLECWGRAEGGGALQMMTYEMETLPIVDPRELSETEQATIQSAVDTLVGERDAEAAIAEIDEVLLSNLGVNLDVSRLQEMQSMIAQRRIRSGDEVNVLMEKLDTFDSEGTQSFETSKGSRDRRLGEFS